MKTTNTQKVRIVAENVATVRRLDPALLFSPMREAENVASARTFAMGACLAAGIPLNQIARAFSRSWRTIYDAEKTCARRRRNSARFRREWETVIAGAAHRSRAAGIPGKPETMAPQVAG